MKNIVVGVDASATAETAARKAAELAVATGATLHVVSAYEKFKTEVVEEGPEKFDRSTEDLAAEHAVHVIYNLKRDLPALVAEPSAVEGKPGEALVQRAHEVDAELIVIGNKRVQGPSRVFGSIATDVMHKAPCDVYVAHTVER
ncbi:universal stress protein [Nocardioides bruguierae]|uniref:Universal stress protein n=1 Tax=Nocardioides bruguierae TaxID=2945102 RepID=A0A9X2IFF4_9ACTN|nr:universal stress protein [Nocardioides bruguierae]MCL8026757.1 universal stress protein [Nocardioides bruguierae]MCM0621023.1 universal stress protein [Nocardioides bruguierae]